MKPWYRSRTIWAGAVIAVLGGINSLSDGGIIHDPKTLSTLLAIAGVLKILLRIGTSTPVDLNM